MTTIDTPIELSINRSYAGKSPTFSGKAEKDAWWGAYNGAFKNTAMTPRQLAMELARGWGFTAKLSGYRKKDNFASAQHLGTDHDTEDLRSSLDTLARDPFIQQYGMFIYTTASHTADRPRARVIYVLDKPVVDRDLYESLQYAMLLRYPEADASGKDAARLWFGSPNCEIRWIGNTLPVGILLPDQATEAHGSAAARPGKHPHAQPIPDVIPQGQRYTVLFSMAGTMRRRGLSHAAILAALKVENAARCKPPMADDELQDMADSVTRYAPEPDAAPDLPADYVPPEPESPPDEYADASSAKTHGADIIGADLPTIRINGRGLTQVTDDAMSALIQANNPPVLLVRSGRLVCVGLDEEGRPSVTVVDEHILRRRMAETAIYATVSNRKDETIVIPANPPTPVVRNILAALQWKLPALAGIIESPTLRPDGTVLMDPGYDRATRLYHAPAPDLQLQAIPDCPTPDDVRTSRGVLEDIFSEFQFDGQASKANAIGLTLTCVIRPAIPGLIPMALLDANQPGSGKTMLAAVVMHTATGHAIMENAPTNPEEWPKVLTTSLKAGRIIVCYDNVDHVLNNGVLSNVLSSEEFANRLLGTNEQGVFSQRSVWIATGNNISVGGDLPRRCYKVSLISDMARPEEREFQKHPDLMAYVKAHRADLLRAVLILARAWYAAGQPLPAGMPKKRGYDGWVRTIYGILSYAGITGFLENLEALYQDSDVEGQQWGAFLYALREVIGTTDSVGKPKEFTVADVFTNIDADKDLAAMAIEAIRGMTVDKDGKFTLASRQAMARAFRTKNRRRVAYITESETGAKQRVDISIQKSGHKDRNHHDLLVISALSASFALLNSITTRYEKNNSTHGVAPRGENNTANDANNARLNLLAPDDNPARRYDDEDEPYFRGGGR